MYDVPFSGLTKRTFHVRCIAVRISKQLSSGHMPRLPAKIVRGFPLCYDEPADRFESAT